MALRDTRTIKLPGRSGVVIPIVGTNKNNELSGISKATREWTISMDGLLSSDYRTDNTADFTAELFGFSCDTTRETSGHSANQLIANAAVRMSDLIVLIQNATYSPILEQYMNNGSRIDCIELARWGWINNVCTCLESKKFSICYITQFRQILDYLVLFIRTIKREETICVHNQSGQPIGLVSSFFSAELGLLGLN
ncbi:MAG: hypothetical protein LBD36_02375 [Holosporales bacterium]|jgi:hypothetical protein|nr:hypothetical protein [Holosporales bacterium]